MVVIKMNTLQGGRKGIMLSNIDSGNALEAGVVASFAATNSNDVYFLCIL